MILFQVALAWLAGSVVAALGLVWLWPALVLGSAGVCFGALLRGRHNEALLVACLLLATLLAADRYNRARPPEAQEGVALLNGDGQKWCLRGEVVSEPEERGRAQRLTLSASAAVRAPRDGECPDQEDAWVQTSGRVLVTTPLFPGYAYGDTLELQGSLETPPSFAGFDYREYLARRGIVSTGFFTSVRVVDTGGGSWLQRLVIRVRRPFSQALERSLPEPEAALAKGILLGQRSDIPDEVSDSLNAAGISHLIAISGFNIMLVAGVAVSSLAWLLGRKQAIACALLLIVVYAVFTGASPSVLRATLMAWIMLGAALAGRPQAALAAVGVAGAGLVLWQPLLISDVAFQLSLASTAGITLLSQRLRDIFVAYLAPLQRGLASFLAENLAVTTAASLAVLPIIAVAFGRVSLVVLPANLVAGPVFVLTLAGAFVTATCGAIDLGLGSLTGQVTLLPLASLVVVGDVFAGLPYATLTLEGLGPAVWALVYVALAALAWKLRRISPAVPDAVRRSRSIPPAVPWAAVLLLLAAVTLSRELDRPDRHLRLTVLDVGQGDALLIETPLGQRVLVDGGPSGAALMQALGRALPSSGRQIDLIVLTHAHEDHAGGFVELLQRYNVGTALAGLIEGQSAAYREWRAALDGNRVPLGVAGPGDWLDLGGGVRIDVLSPLESLPAGQEALNNQSLVLRLVYGEVSFLLAGDIEATAEQALLDSGQGLASTVLKVPHHGSDGSSTPAFLDAVQPRVAVISAGADNDFGHPSPTTRLRFAGTPLLRTDVNGDVSFETDGRSLDVRTQRRGFELLPAGLEGQ